MTVTYTGAVSSGPEFDFTRFYSGAMPSTPTGDFSIAVLVKFGSLYAGDNPYVVGGLSAAGLEVIGQNFTGTGLGTGGNDCFIRAVALNNSTAGLRGRIQVRLINSTTLAATGMPFTSTTSFAPFETALIVIQSNGANIEFWTTKAGGSPVLETSAARNASFTAKALGTWNWGGNGNFGFRGRTQFVAMAAQALTSTDMTNIMAGTDLETIVPVSGNRLALWTFDSTGATLPAKWGATALTRNGTWTNQRVGSPIVPNAGAPAISCTNEPVNYSSPGTTNNTAQTHTFTGAYSAFTPTTFQGRIYSAADLSVVQDWTDLTSFTASAGGWSGTLSIPVGGPYYLSIRDKTDTAKVWDGSSAWLMCPVLVAMGQSPHVLFLGSALTPPTPTVLTATKAYVLGTDIGSLQPALAIQKASVANIGDGGAAMVNRLAQLTGDQPVLITKTAVGGTSSIQWSTRDSFVWPQLLLAMDVVKPKRVLCTWLNGASEGGGLDIPGIKADHDAILTNLDADFTATRGISYRYRMNVHNRDTSNESLNGRTREAQYEWARDHPLAGSKVLLGPSWPDMMHEQEATGTAQGGTSTTITLALADDADVGTKRSAGTVYIRSGTGSGQTRLASAYNTTTKVLTVTAAWATIPDATSVYAIWNGSAHPNYIGALNYSTRYARDTAYQFGYCSTTGQGPRPLSVAIPTGGDGSILDVTFAHKHGSVLRTPNGGTSAKQVAGFRVQEYINDSNSTILTVVDATITSGNTVRLRLASAPSVKANLRVSYGWLQPVPGEQFDYNGQSVTVPGTVADRGIYATSTAYAVGDVFRSRATQAYSPYLVTTAHTSTATIDQSKAVPLLGGLGDLLYDDAATATGVGSFADPLGGLPAYNTATDLQPAGAAPSAVLAASGFFS